MNDFTKEELEGLKNVLLQSREDYPAMHKDNDCTSLLSKIQSMIENYPKECPEIRDANMINSCPTCGEHHE